MTDLMQQALQRCREEQARTTQQAAVVAPDFEKLRLFFSVVYDTLDYLREESISLLGSLVPSGTELKEAAGRAEVSPRLDLRIGSQTYMRIRIAENGHATAEARQLRWRCQIVDGNSLLTNNLLAREADVVSWIMTNIIHHADASPVPPVVPRQVKDENDRYFRDIDI